MGAVLSHLRSPIWRIASQISVVSDTAKAAGKAFLSDAWGVQSEPAAVFLGPVTVAAFTMIDTTAM